MSGGALKQMSETEGGRGKAFADLDVTFFNLHKHKTHISITQHFVIYFNNYLSKQATERICITLHNMQHIPSNRRFKNIVLLCLKKSEHDQNKILSINLLLDYHRKYMCSS